MRDYKLRKRVFNEYPNKEEVAEMIEAGGGGSDVVINATGISAGKLATIKVGDSLYNNDLFMVTGALDSSRSASGFKLTTYGTDFQYKFGVSMRCLVNGNNFNTLIIEGTLSIPSTNFNSADSKADLQYVASGIPGYLSVYFGTSYDSPTKVITIPMTFFNDYIVSGFTDIYYSGTKYSISAEISTMGMDATKPIVLISEGGMA